jgi:hypothetical protein
MRCMIRDMMKRRRIREELERVRLRERRGYKIDEVKLARLTAQSKKLSTLIMGRWHRLHRRMNREATRRAEVEGMFVQKEEKHGNAANP